MFKDVSVNKDAVNRKPVDAMIGTDFILSFTNIGSERLVCFHSVANGKIGTATPVDKQGLVSVVLEICGDLQPETWRDPKVLYQSDKLLIWHRKSSKKPEPIWFRVGDQHIQLRVKLPSLVFVLGRELRVYAACSSHVSRATRLYHAPLCNVNEQGILCLGSATRPSASASTEVKIAQFEDALLGSNFTHTNCKKTFKALEGSDKNTTKGHIEMWKHFEALGKAPCSKDLYPLNRTLESLVQTLESKS